MSSALRLVIARVVGVRCLRTVQMRGTVAYRGHADTKGLTGNTRRDIRSDRDIMTDARELSGSCRCPTLIMWRG